MKKLLFAVFIFPICAFAGDVTFRQTGSGGGSVTIQSAPGSSSSSGDGVTIFAATATGKFVPYGLNASTITINGGGASSMRIETTSGAVSGGVGPQVHRNYIWNKVDEETGTFGSFEIIVSSDNYAIGSNHGPSVGRFSRLSFSPSSWGFDVDNAAIFSGDINGFSINNSSLTITDAEGESLSISVPDLSASYSLKYPLDDGNAGDVLSTDGDGNLDFIPMSGGGSSIYPATATIITPQGINSSTISLTGLIYLNGSGGSLGQVINSNATTDADWTSVLVAADGSNSIDFNNRFLYSADGNYSVDWQNHWLQDDQLALIVSWNDPFNFSPQIGFLGETPKVRQSGDVSIALAEFGLMDIYGTYDSGRVTFLSPCTSGILRTDISGNFVCADERTVNESTFSITVGIPVGYVVGSTYCTSIPYSCTISSYTMIADQSGSISVHIASSTFANYPTLSNMSGFPNAPTLSSAIKRSAGTSGWTGTTLEQNSQVCGVVDSASTVTWANIVLWVMR